MVNNTFKIQEEDMIVEDVPLKMRVIPIEDKMTRSYQRSFFTSTKAQRFVI